MNQDSTDIGFRIHGADRAVYGPVELPILVQWIKEERVVADSWVYSDAQNIWSKAANMSELQMFFRSSRKAGGDSASADSVSSPGGVLKPGALRRIKIFSDFTDEQLSHFLDYLEPVQVPQWTDVAKQGQPGDSMYFILEGELRVRMVIAGKETVLTTLSAGEFVGEMALFDQSPRSADVISNTPASLLRLTDASLQRLLTHAPNLAAPFLFAMGRTMAARIRADNKRYRDAVNFARSGGAGV